MYRIGFLALMISFPAFAQKDCSTVRHSGSRICTAAIVEGAYLDKRTGQCVADTRPNGCYRFPFENVQECQDAVAAGECSAKPKADCFAPTQHGGPFAICTQAIVHGVIVDRATGKCQRSSAPNGCYSFPFTSISECESALDAGRCNRR